MGCRGLRLLLGCSQVGWGWGWKLQVQHIKCSIKVEKSFKEGLFKSTFAYKPVPAYCRCRQTVAYSSIAENVHALRSRGSICNYPCKGRAALQHVISLVSHLPL